MALSLPIRALIELTTCDEQHASLVIWLDDKAEVLICQEPERMLLLAAEIAARFGGKEPR